MSPRLFGAINSTGSSLVVSMVQRYSRPALLALGALTLHLSLLSSVLFISRTTSSQNYNASSAVILTELIKVTIAILLIFLSGELESGVERRETGKEFEIKNKDRGMGNVEPSEKLHQAEQGKSCACMSARRWIGWIASIELTIQRSSPTSITTTCRSYAL